MEEQVTALVKVNPETDIQVLSWLAESNRLRDYAEDRVIVTADDLKPTTNDLSEIALIKKSMEGKRKEYVQPLDAYKKSINDTFKMLMEPIETADKVTRQKVLAFNAEQERIRREQEEINRMRVEAAKKEMELKGELTESVNLVEVIPEAPKRTATDMGISGMRDNWKWEVINFALVDDMYKMINPAVLTPAAKSYKDTRTIPGIRIYNEPIIAVNTR